MSDESINLNAVNENVSSISKNRNITTMFEKPNPITEFVSIKSLIISASYDNSSNGSSDCRV